MQQQMLVRMVCAVAPGPEAVPVEIVRGRKKDRHRQGHIQPHARGPDRNEQKFLAEIQHAQVDHYTGRADSAKFHEAFFEEPGQHRMSGESRDQIHATRRSCDAASFTPASISRAFANTCSTVICFRHWLSPSQGEVRWLYAVRHGEQGSWR